MHASLFRYWLTFVVSASVGLSGCAADTGNATKTPPSSVDDIVEDEGADEAEYQCWDDRESVGATLTFRGGKLAISGPRLLQKCASAAFGARMTERQIASATATFVHP